MLTFNLLIYITIVSKCCFFVATCMTWWYISYVASTNWHIFYIITVAIRITRRLHAWSKSRFLRTGYYLLKNVWKPHIFRVSILLLLSQPNMAQPNIPQMEIILAITFHPASFLADGLVFCMTVPPTRNPNAVKMRDAVPVIMLALDAENKYWTSMYLAWYLKYGIYPNT